MLRTTERSEVITEIIIQALVELRVPWRGNFGFPRNILSNRRYDGVNPFLLNIAADRHGWTSPYWGTYSQWISQGSSPKPRPSHIKPGEWSQEIVLYKVNPCGKMELGRWSAFNLDQTENGFANLRGQRQPLDLTLADHAIRATNAKINFKETQEAAYYYREDTIVFPLRGQFLRGPGGIAGFYHSLFHEVAHWSEPRLDWEGTEAERELRAEIVADYLCTEFNVPMLPMLRRTNHRNFLDRWIALMRKDAELIFRLSAAASKAADFILGFSQRVGLRHNPPAEIVV